MRRIYPKEWVSMHPYTKTGTTDNYYCRLVNRIIAVLYDYDIMEWEIEPEDEIYEDTAIFLVGWFEDIISQTGVSDRRLAGVHFAVRKTVWQLVAFL